MMRKSFIRIPAFAAVLLLACLSLSGLLFGGAVSYADTGDDVIRPARLSPADTACTYRYFDYPTAIAATADGFIVADGNTAYEFAYDAQTGAVQEKAAYPLPAEVTRLFARADTLYALGGDTLYLDIGAPEGDESITPHSISGVADFAVTDTAIAVLRADRRTVDVYAFTDDTGDAAPTVTLSAEKEIKKIAAGERGIYMTCASRYDRYYDDVLFLPHTEDGWGTAQTCLSHVPEICGIDTLRDIGIVVYTRTGIETYAHPVGARKLSLRRRCDGADVAGIAAAGESIYGLGDEKSVFYLDAAFTARTTILASAHDELGFYRGIAGIASSTNGIAVADERNGRVQLLSEEGIRTINGLTRPVAVAIDDLGNVYVAHDGNRIDAYTATGAHLREVASPKDAQIVDLVTDADDKLYILSQDGRVLDSDGKTLADRTVAIAVSHKDNKLYRADDEGNVFRLGEDTRLFACAAPVPAFCIDHDGAFYMLTEDGGIQKYNGGNYGPEITPAFASVYPTAIAMNAFTSDKYGMLGNGRGLRYGDLLVSDGGAHALLALCGDADNGFNVNENFDTDAPSKPIDRPSAPLSPIGDTPILYYTNYACTLYEQPAKIHPIAKLKADFTVIVPYDEEHGTFTYDETAEFTYVLLDNDSLADGAKKPLTGYVRTKYLTAHAYTQEHPAACHTTAPNVGIYKYPTRDLEPFATLPSNNVTLCDFVLHENAQGDALYGYEDNFADSYVWYRVRYDNDKGERCEGYVRGDFILGGENPNIRTEYPRTNAKIISKSKKNDKLGAVLYEKNEAGEIVPVEDAFYENLPVGKKVEVVGAFDSSKKYTHIYYYHEKLGTVTWMYVETANLEYEGVNKVQVIAAVVIVLTVILGIVLLVRYCRIKRRQKDIAKI